MIHLQPQPGDIGLTQTPGPIGHLIQLGQWLNGDGFGHFQHAYLVLPGNQLIEAQPGGARIRPLTQYDPNNSIYLYPAGITPAQRQAVCDHALKYVGTPYSFADYTAIAAHRLHLPLPGLRRYIASTGHMLCSQLVDQAYTDAGIGLFTDGRWPGYATPMSLYDLLAEHVDPTSPTATLPGDAAA